MNNSQMSGDQGGQTGTRDSTYDLTAVLYHALQGAENCQIYMGDAEGKQEHRQFFEQALQAQKQLAEQAKRLLHDALMEETGRQGGQAGGQGGSAMSFGQQGGGMQNDQGSAQFGQPQGQRHNEMTTGGGGSSSF